MLKYKIPQIVTLTRVLLEAGSCGEDDYGISFAINGNLKIIPEGYHIHRGFSVFWLKVSIKLG